MFLFSLLFSSFLFYSLFSPLLVLLASFPPCSFLVAQFSARVFLFPVLVSPHFFPVCCLLFGFLCPVFTSCILFIFLCLFCIFIANLSSCKLLLVSCFCFSSRLAKFQHFQYIVVSYFFTVVPPKTPSFFSYIFSASSFTFLYLYCLLSSLKLLHCTFHLYLLP